MSISAITVSYQTGPVLRDGLAALLAAESIDEVVVVDNGNPSEIEIWLDQLAALEPRLIIVRGHGNIGFGAGCNRGAARASGAELLFVNPDVILAAAAPALMADALTGAGPVALAGGDLRDADGRPDRGSRRDPVTLWSAFVSFSGLSALERWSPVFRDLHRHRDPIPDRTADVAVVSGALMMMSRQGFDTLRGFDEGYFLHVEDIDLCWRVKQAGGRVLFVPGARGVHSRSSSAAPRREIEHHKAAGLRRFFRKSSRSPLERVAAELVGAILLVALPARAR